MVHLRSVSGVISGKGKKKFVLRDCFYTETVIKGEKNCQNKLYQHPRKQGKIYTNQENISQGKGQLKMIRQHCGCSVTPPLVLCHTGDILYRTPSVRGLGHWSRRGERTPCPVSLFGPVWGLPEEPTGFCFTQGTTLSRPKAGVVMVKGRFSKAFKGK